MLDISVIVIVVLLARYLLYSVVIQMQNILLNLLVGGRQKTKQKPIIVNCCCGYVSHSSTVSKRLFKMKCPTLFPRDRAMLLSPGSFKSQRMLSRTYFDSVHLCWKYVTKVRLAEFCHAFHLSCPCYQIIKASQYFQNKNSLLSLPCWRDRGCYRTF